MAAFFPGYFIALAIVTVLTPVEATVRWLIRAWRETAPAKGEQVQGR